MKWPGALVVLPNHLTAIENRVGVALSRSTTSTLLPFLHKVLGASQSRLHCSGLSVARPMASSWMDKPADQGGATAQTPSESIVSCGRITSSCACGRWSLVTNQVRLPGALIEKLGSRRFAETTSP